MNQEGVNLSNVALLWRCCSFKASRGAFFLWKGEWTRVAMTQWEAVDRECFRHRSEPDNIHEPSINSFILLISLIHYLYMYTTRKS